MAKKVVLGQRPDKIVHVVEFPLPTGEPGAIECHFRYRTREEFGALLDATFGPEGDNAMVDGKLSMERHQALTCQANGAYLHAILTGWNLDVPLSLEACVQFANECPGGAQAVMTAYRAAIVEGRLGN